MVLLLRARAATLLRLMMRSPHRCGAQRFLRRRVLERLGIPRGSLW